MTAPQPTAGAAVGPVPGAVPGAGAGAGAGANKQLGPAVSTGPTDPAGPTDRLVGWPAFVRELESTLAVHAQYILHGNIRDLHTPPTAAGGTAAGSRASDAPSALPLSLVDLLWEALRPNGYTCLLRFDAVDGITVVPPSPNATAAAERLVGTGALGREISLDKLRPLLAAVCGPRRPGSAEHPRAAFVVDYAARLTRMPGQLDGRERDFFLFCQKLAHTTEVGFGGPADRPGALYNPLIWLVEGERDLPSWLSAGSDRIRSIAIPLPDLAERQRVATMIANNFGIRAPVHGSAADRQVTAFAQATGGLTTRSMWEVMRLAFDRKIPFADIGDAVRIFRLGVAENPWATDHLRERIRIGEREVADKVRGQRRAITKTFDILKRAALGLSGAQASSTGSRPRGVIFFAGPTGVGKTELAKQVAATLFGRTDAYLRFDMSEFASEHAADRLIGAPPGYVGFEAGGELTSAVRRQPFRVVLFDEIEKAHRGVLDKFLQILEDGRLTDGQGTTTHFSECVLIFTSNLGVMRTDPATGQKVPIVEPGTSYDDLERRVKAAITDHFTTEIGRPELLNRLGDNIVVFDFISDRVAEEIFKLQVENIRRRLMSEHRMRLDLTPAVTKELQARCCANLTHGGRGVGNELESWLVNPLARALFDLPGGMPHAVYVEEVMRDDDGQVSLRLSVDATSPR